MIFLTCKYCQCELLFHITLPKHVLNFLYWKKKGNDLVRLLILLAFKFQKDIV